LNKDAGAAVSSYSKYMATSADLSTSKISLWNRPAVENGRYT